MVDRHLAKVVIDMAVFLEYSDGNVLGEDASVEAMEQMAAELQLMSESAKEALIQRFHELADEYGGRAAFVSNLPETLGLA